MVIFPFLAFAVVKPAIQQTRGMLLAVALDLQHGEGERSQEPTPANLALPRLYEVPPCHCYRCRSLVQDQPYQW